MLIFQGRQDESVSPDIVERFAQHRAEATLHMLDDTHQLKNSLDFIWRETQRFLELRLVQTLELLSPEPYKSL